MIIKARAKINLTLGILGIREDNYHEVEMIMQSLKLHDIIEVTPKENGIEIKSNSSLIPLDEKNLCYKAALLLQKYCHSLKGVSINIQKNIPIQAGLAGGSADAAAVLKALNTLWNLNLNLKELMELGSKIGSDIPFCLLENTALAKGRGEVLTPLKLKNQMGVLLIKPPYGISTQKAYNIYDSLPNGEQPNTNAMIKALATGDFKKICELLYNVLERPVKILKPKLFDYKNELKKIGAKGALMSGSGPTIYALFPSESLAKKALLKLKLDNCQVIVTSTY